MLRYVLTGHIDCCPDDDDFDDFDATTTTNTTTFIVEEGGKQQQRKGGTKTNTKNGGGGGGEEDRGNTRHNDDETKKETNEKKKEVDEPTTRRTRGRSDTSVYSVLFNALHPEWYRVFAACAANRLMLYKIDDFIKEEEEDIKEDKEEDKEDEEETVERTTLLQCYVDADPNETYYTCCWCSKKNALVPYVACAGAKGVVRVLNCKKKDFCGALVGHGGEINDLRAHPSMPNIIASASKDLSVRLWNVSNGVCVAIFSGARGHRNDVLSVDFHPDLFSCPESGREDVVVIATGGMDNAVKVWSTRGKKVSKAIEDSESWEDEIVEFPTAQIHVPEFSTFHAHNHFVDCVRYFGDVIFSKSVENKIVAWTPDFSLIESSANAKKDNTSKNNDRNNNDKNNTLEVDINMNSNNNNNNNNNKFRRSFRKLKSFNLVDAENWWVRFSLAKETSVLCCGNTKGLVRVWKFCDSDSNSDDDSSSSSSSSSSSDDDASDFEKTTPKGGRRDKNVRAHAADNNKQTRRRRARRRSRRKGALVADLKGLPKETVVRQAEVSFDGTIVLAGCDGGYIYRWDCVDQDAF